jgi:hypothetical protein
MIKKHLNGAYENLKRIIAANLGQQDRYLLIKDNRKISFQEGQNHEFISSIFFILRKFQEETEIEKIMTILKGLTPIEYNQNSDSDILWTLILRRISKLLSIK